MVYRNTSIKFWRKEYSNIPKGVPYKQVILVHSIVFIYFQCWWNTFLFYASEINLFSDINECSLGICSQSCSNSEGSYSCDCYTGYALQADKTSCKRESIPNTLTRVYHFFAFNRDNKVSYNSYSNIRRFCIFQISSFKYNSCLILFAVRPSYNILMLFLCQCYKYSTYSVVHD